MSDSKAIEAALQAHFANPDDPATARALYDVIARADVSDVDVAVHRALLKRPPVAAPRRVPEPPVAPPLVSLAAPEAPSGPKAEPVPAMNWAGNIPMTGALAAFEVAGVPDVNEVIEGALGGTDPSRRVLRALGTMHSSSRVVTTPGTIVDTGALTPASAASGILRRVAKVDPAVLRPGVDAAKLVSVGSGLRVAEVVAALEHLGRALPMLGAYTGQTYVGALCTGTHGSGIAQGALHTAVRSIDVVSVGADGKPVLHRVERTQGITDPAKVPPGLLIQDDGAFRALLVGLGNLGVITSVIVETVAPYHLQADRIHREWSEIRKILADVDTDGYPRYFANTYTAGVLMNPYPWPLKPEGPRKGVINRGWIPAQPPSDPEPPTPSGGCNLLFDIARFLGNYTALTPWALNMTIDTMPATTNEYGTWFDVLASSGDLPQGYSVEYCFPLQSYLPALDAILAAMYDLAWEETKMIAGTLSIRFVKGDDAYLSMAEGRDSVFLEFLTLAGIHAAPAVFAKMEEVALAHGARPHWGQYFDLEAMPRIVPSYPEAHRYVKDGLARFDPTRAFDNDFTRALRDTLAV